MKKLLLSLILTGCFDYSALTSDRCPDYKPCKSNQICVEGTCVDTEQPIVDMSITVTDMKMNPPPDLTTLDMQTDPASDACFKKYVPKYYTQSFSNGVCWMPSYWQANNFKECKPPNCKQDQPTHCSGEMVERFICNGMSLDMYVYGPLNSYYAAIVDTLSNVTYHEYIGDTTGRPCERYPKTGTDCPSNNWVFYAYLCENLI